VICWLPYFADTVVPIHDTLYVTESFHCFYSAIHSHGELIRWFPYGNYGTPADFYQLALHPTHYAVGIAGLLLGVDDTLLLAKIAMLLNELLLALGLYLLSRELYSLPLTWFLVTMGGVLSVSWFEQAMFNLFIFYLLPLVMFLVLRFFKTGKPTYLFLAGVTEICSLLGNVTYAVPMHFWMLTLFAAVLAFEHRQAVKNLVSPKTLVNPWLWVLLAVIGVIGYFMVGATGNLALLSPGRDPTTGKASLDNFLNYGRPPMTAAVFGFATGSIPHGPNTYYIGLLPLAMFVYALATESRKTFIGIAAMSVALIWLSIGGGFATLIFFLPGMSLYRHIALIYGIIGVMLLLGAGFGFERLALRLAGRETAAVMRPLRRFLILIALAVLIVVDYWLCRFSKDPPLPVLLPGWQAFFAFRLAVNVAAAGAVYAWLRRRAASSTTPALLPACILGLAFFVDIASFRAQVFETIVPMDPRFDAKLVFKAERVPYRASRSEIAPDERGRSAVEFLTRSLPYNNAVYCFLYGFAGIDPCRPLFRTDTLSRGIDDMIRARGGKLEPWPGDEYLPPADAAFKRSLGCGTPKLRLTDRPIFAATEADAVRLFTGLVDPDISVVLSPGGEVAADEPKHGEPRQLGVIDVEAFSPNRLQARVLVENPHPVWLVYADAWNPGWKARIDGQAAAVRRANLGFKAVRLESGAHDVEFYFFDRRRTFLAWVIALIGTAFGIALCAALLAAGAAPFFRKRRLPAFEAPTRSTAPAT
jgi:hypothetical protein